MYSRDEFVSVNNELTEYYEMKNPETSIGFTVSSQWKPIVRVAKNTLLTKIRVFKKLNKID